MLKAARPASDLNVRVSRIEAELAMTHVVVQASLHGNVPSEKWECISKRGDPSPRNRFCHLTPRVEQTDFSEVRLS